MKKPLLILTTIVLFFCTISFQAQATIHTVQVATNSFSPAALTGVTVGDTIRWTWVSGSHTTTSTSVPTGATPWDMPINSGATTFDYHVTVAGSYGYQCNFHAALGMVGTIVVTGGTSGISSVAAQAASLKFFPNPVKSDLSVLFNSTSEGAGYIRIYDLTGKEVYNQPTDIHIGANSMVMPMSNLGSGIYMAELAIGSEQIGVRRVVKE